MKIYKGKLVEEHLKDLDLYNFLTVLSTNKKTVVNAETGEKEDKTEVQFEVNGDLAPAVVTELSERLKNGPRYAVLKNADEVNVVYPNKIFTYYPDDNESRQKAIDYGQSLMISAEELKSAF